MTSGESTIVGKQHLFESLQRYPAFRALWASNLLFAGGSWTQVLILGWITLDLTNSAFLLALFTTARLAPMLLGPFGGLLADRMDRFMLLTALLVLNIVVTAALMLLLVLDRLEFWHLLTGGLILGLAQSPAQPARMTLLMDLVGKEHLSNAVSLNDMAMNIPRIAGPAIGGAMLAVLGPVLSLGLSAAWFVGAGFTLLPLRWIGRTIGTVSGESVWRQLVDGFRIMGTHPGIAAALIVSIAANLCVWPVMQAFLPVFARDVLHAGEAGLGIMMTAMGAGALAGTFVMASMGDFRWKGKMFIWSTAAFGLFFGLFALSTSFPLSLAFMFLGGLASSAVTIMQATLMLILAPEEFRGRAMGVQMLAIGVVPLATLAQGAIAAFVGVPATAAAAGFLLVLSMGAVYVLAPSLKKAR